MMRGSFISSQGILFLLSGIALQSLSVYGQIPDYSTCSSLEAFSQDCLDFMVGHDDDAMCVDFESNMNTSCIDQVERERERATSTHT